MPNFGPDPKQFNNSDSNPDDILSIGPDGKPIYRSPADLGVNYSPSDHASTDHTGLMGVNNFDSAAHAATDHTGIMGVGGGGYVLTFFGDFSGTSSGSYFTCEVGSYNSTVHPIPISGNITAIAYDITIGGGGSVTTTLGTILSSGTGVQTGSSAVTAGNTLSISYSITTGTNQGVLNVYIEPS